MIRRALDSVAPHVDAWSITDTGSTDDTRKIIQNYFAVTKLPGELNESPFVDFGVSRTRTVESARQFCLTHGIDYLLLLDADETIEVRDPDWKKRLAGAPYMLAYDDPLSYRTMYLVPAGLPWRFIGRTHEYIQADGDSPTRENFDGIVLHDHGDGGFKADKYTRDVELLRRTLTELPNDERAWFYLGESYYNGNIDLVEALHAYTKRAQLGGFEEEAWYASYRCGLCLERLAGDSGDVWPALLAYFQAWQRRPWRAEPLFEIVRLCCMREMYLLGAVVGEYTLAHVVPRPERADDILFIDRKKHGSLLADWLAVCLWWAGYRERSSELLRQILDEGAGEATARRIERNLRLTGNLPSTPGIDSLVEACRRLREHNLCLPCMVIASAAIAHAKAFGHDIPWQLDFERSVCGYYVPGCRELGGELTDSLIRRREIPVESRDRLQSNRAFYVRPLPNNILRIQSLQDAPEEIHLIGGYDDCRIVWVPGGDHAGPWAIANAIHPTHPPLRAMFLLRLQAQADGPFAIKESLHLHGYEADRDQKYWMPVIVDGMLKLVYSCDPTVILIPDLTSGHCVVESRTQPPVWCEELRGGSQLVSIEDAGGPGFVAFTHAVLEEHPRRSFHALVRFDSRLAVTGVSRPFVLGEKGVELVAGCARDGDDLVVTWSENNATAWAGRIRITDAVDLFSRTDRLGCD